jgi:hypothetical protein
MSGRAPTVKNIPNDNASAVGKASATGNANLNAGKADAANAPSPSQGQANGHGNAPAGNPPVVEATTPVTTPDSGTTTPTVPDGGSTGERVSTYTENGLRYEIRVFEENGSIFAEITVIEGHMDVNAVYFGDSDYSGDSVSLGGPLNMNGGGSRLDGQPVQWDGATEVSRPGLGRDGFNKPSYLTEGETLRVELDVDSLDDVDIIGVRATSTSTPEGSIKGVSRVEEHDDDDDDDDDDEPTYDKLFFVVGTGENEYGVFESGVSIFLEDNGSESPNDAFLPEGSEGTLEEYIARFNELAGSRERWPESDDIQIIRIYQVGEDGQLTEVGTLDPSVLNTNPLPEVDVEDEDMVAEAEDDEGDEDEMAAA